MLVEEILVPRVGFAVFTVEFEHLIQSKFKTTAGCQANLIVKISGLIRYSGRNIRIHPPLPPFVAMPTC